MKGIVLAGGSGTRLHPATLAASKQLLPVYDKPMIYYPLSVLMLADIREILVISTEQGVLAMRSLLGDGSQLGLSLSYEVQTEPRGIADAFVIGERFIGGDASALVLGDNLFHGANFRGKLQEARKRLDGCVLFGYPVQDPERYAVGELDLSGRLVSIEEKPEKAVSNNAITGLYLYDSDVVEIAKQVRPSARGELEITDVNLMYLREKRAGFVQLGRGFTWLDTGTYQSLLEAGQFVQVMERRQGIRIACLEELALRMGFITAEECRRLGARMNNSDYGRYVIDIADSLGSVEMDRML
ncbi:glucose-1-phosphate thymidylyltransferase RfbA [Nocardiopsis dassonvillei]|uniref:glucose-1-phosphate thymidylyltransferase RfbA n=1 Tax=Nocardiopsis dassonvillei TaxID=2014 RepID=UPI0020108E66|nr:glucose-1-phosphate thymidylyltransferase RfbA [Nocardiopsis dassonvillei]MCK9868095.1 glucose-1-phosphate thymidylyltransferase RfbA [Nocardiopsis dassonvillei]